MSVKSVLEDALLVILFSYGLLYFSYKYGQPSLGNLDYRRYEKMVDSPLNLKAINAPFVLRQIPTLVAYGLKTAGFYYPTRIAFASSNLYHNETSQRNFFALLLSNYLAFASSTILIIQYLRKLMPEKRSSEIYFPVLALSLGYFMVPLDVIAPLSQGYGWLAAVIITIGFIERRITLLIFGFVIAIFSRETLIIFFCVLSVVTMLLTGRRTKILQSSVIIMTLLFALLMIIRNKFTYGNENQLSIIFLIHKTFSYPNKMDYFFQAFLTQGLLIFLVIKLFKRSKKTGIAYLFTMLFIVLIGGNGVGRIIGESYPFLILMYLIPYNKFTNTAFTLKSEETVERKSFGNC